MWLNLLSMGVKTASHIYQNKQKTKQLMSDAQIINAKANGKGRNLNIKRKLLKVIIKVGKMNLSLFSYLFLFCYWAILFSLTTLRFVIE